MYERLGQGRDFFKEDVVEFTQKLVQIPSPSLEEESVARLVEEKMKELGFESVFRDKFGNVIGIEYALKPGKTILLNSHLDTVPVNPDGEWVKPPYCGEIENGKLFGVGASDCKAGLASQIFAGILLKRSMLPLEGNLVVAATVAEENGRSLGVRGLMEHTLPELGLKPDFVILGEPTDLGLYYGHDGWAEFDILIEGENGIQVDDIAHTVFNNFESSHPSEFSSAEVEDSNTKEPFFETTGGGHRATVPMSRRLNPVESVEQVMGQIQQNVSLVAQSAGSVKVDVMVKQENQKLYTGRTSFVRNITHAWETDPFQPIMERSRQALAAAGCEVRSGKWKLDRLGMGTAGSTFVREYNLPTIGFGPGTEEMAHEINESVETEKIVKAMYGTAAIVHSLIGMPIFGWCSDEI